MYSESDLEAAVAAGALTPEAAASLRNHVATARHSPAVDEESFRLVTGFNDIFVSVAAVILLVAVGAIGQSLGREPGAPSPMSGGFVAGTAWLLAEYFTRRRRMALPSIILLLAFVGGIFFAGLGTGVLLSPSGDGDVVGSAIGAFSTAFAAVAAWVHWRRFRVPITVAAGAAAVAGFVVSPVAALVAEEAVRDVMLGVVLILGLAIFLFAMRWDASDLRRETRRSDVAFWLHLLAAPMIVHPVFTLLGLTDGSATVAEAIIVLLVYVLLGLTALAIDRRALLVSALAYVLYALSSLFDRFGAVELSFALTALVIGSALLLLSAFWHTARRGVVTPLPANLRGKLPVLERTPATA